MHKESFKVHWPQLRGHIQTAWSQLSVQDLDRVAGNFDHLLNLLEKTYGFSRSFAEEQFNRRMAILSERPIQVEFERRLAKVATRAGLRINTDAPLLPEASLENG